MAYENKTVDYVYNLLINSFQEKFNNSLRLLPKSFIVVLSKVLAGIFVILYKLAGWNLLQMFPDILLGTAGIGDNRARFQVRQNFFYHWHNLQDGRT